MNVNTFVVINAQIEGIHHWPEAFEEVSYLRYPHRHMFHIKMSVQVSHGNREVEIIRLKQRLIATLKTDWLSTKLGLCDFGRMSCEDLGGYILSSFPEADTVEVLEDGENGAEVCRLEEL